MSKNTSRRRESRDTDDDQFTPIDELIADRRQNPEHAKALDDAREWVKRAFYSSSATK